MARCSIHQKSRLGNYTPKRRPRRPDEVLRRSIAVSAGIVSASVQYVRNIRSKQRPAALTSTLPSTQLSPQRPLKRRCGGMWSFGLILKSWLVNRSLFLSYDYASTCTGTRRRLFAAVNPQSLLDELHKLASFREHKLLLIRRSKSLPTRLKTRRPDDQRKTQELLDGGWLRHRATSDPR